MIRGPPLEINLLIRTTKLHYQNELPTKGQKMALIKITKTDLMKGRTFDPDWYPVEVVSMEEKPAKSDGSTNYNYLLRILPPHEMAGGEFYRNFSEKAIGMIVPFVEACGGKIDPEGGSFDPEACVGRKLQIYNNNKMYEGKMRNDVTDFRPL